MFTEQPQHGDMAESILAEFGDGQDMPDADRIALAQVYATLAVRDELAELGGTLDRIGEQQIDAARDTATAVDAGLGGLLMAAELARPKPWYQPLLAWWRS